MHLLLLHIGLIFQPLLLTAAFLGLFDELSNRDSKVERKILLLSYGSPLFQDFKRSNVRGLPVPIRNAKVNTFEKKAEASRIHALNS
ncbi:hypothetical protein K469DRAFT_267412 [Zopfia rhizophila CBS 207.26]|uniref:Uncharacterized protein n=1 Tax=Zopfia rhizophila CBS 207.26 TaxID=1314779 RepID=A0A6A6DN27_9PEZI|nr:hypothetical protein K469DRAFT_267412 [Zopfia rhizophila CBS 207.26]